KRYHGDIDAVGAGGMLAAMTATRGSAVYVAVERVTGTLEGRAGSFVIHHRGTMDRGAQALEISVVPDSGTGRLTGIAGAMRIIIEEGKHSYEFDYTLPEDG
ncbi:MAG TPA: DUF3224 domain-containing protein, partial [Gemmatimonadales bacterium]|nr:DUF3224 domain-containing protein [Gemmatimonadales bacterium]